ncbi:amidohydrolase [Microbacterium sp. KRD172]|uniref:amidohydrolase n=1 Tax=Microbacterium sp. KRD172 TaxID=2729727 RepID=UPI0019D1CAD0|nr:amidohydrolase [Microbacterium sp. KRD172]
MKGSLAVIGAGTILSGDWRAPIIDDADTIIIRDGVITAVGSQSDLQRDVEASKFVVDAVGTTVAPGLIDSHCHVVLGDYTPRQKTVDFLASYVHGGITSVVSPGEIHAPGRPSTASGVKALAIAAKECFDNFHPNGMTVHAGAVVLEPTLQKQDFADLQAAGVHLAKFGFGKFADPADGLPQVTWAKQYGITVMSHSGGASIPGSKPITPEHLMLLAPDVCGHVNGGPTSLAEEGVDRIMDETTMALQLVQAGNIRSAVRIINRATDTDVFERVVIGSDTPTGTGVMPLGVMKTVAELSSLSDVAPGMVWAAATGNNANVWDLPAGFIAPGRAADIIVMDAPWGSTKDDALGALSVGDIPGISAVITGGVIRALRSRNTPQAARAAEVSPRIEHLEASGH